MMVQYPHLFVASLLAGVNLIFPVAQGKALDPFEILPLPKESSELVKALGEKETTLYVVDDVLTILHRSDAKQINMTGGIQKPLSPIPGTNLWGIRLRMKGWERAFFSYSLFDPEQLKPGMRLNMIRWRGPEAPAAPEEAFQVQGQILKRTIMSKSLNEERALTIYLPPNAPKSGLRALLMADGGGCEGAAKVLEPLILSGKMEPVAIVGVHSGENKNKPGEYKPELDMRAMEYLPGGDLYDKHMEFFAGEVVEWAIRELGVSTKREDRAVFGFSNGGSFSAGATLDRPDVFGAAIPMSVGVPSEKVPTDKSLARMFFVAGALEPSFLKGTTQAYEHAKSVGADANLKVYFSGHDWEMWKLALAEFAPLIFPVERAHQAARESCELFSGAPTTSRWSSLVGEIETNRLPRGRKFHFEELAPVLD